MTSTKLWIHTAASYPPQCETQCLREGSSQQVKIECFLDVSSPSHPVSEFSMCVRSSYHLLPAISGTATFRVQSPAHLQNVPMFELA